MATISGFSILVFGFGIRELRSWNRISVFIAFFAFADGRVRARLAPAPIAGAVVDDAGRRGRAWR